MINAGCIISGASDGPVSPFNVPDEIETDITRNSPYAGEDNTDMHRWPEQALTPYEMLEAYTQNVAYENFEEKDPYLHMSQLFPVKTTGLAGGLHHPYKGILPACARKAH